MSNLVNKLRVISFLLLNKKDFKIWKRAIYNIFIIIRNVNLKKKFGCGKEWLELFRLLFCSNFFILIRDFRAR